MTEEIWKAVPGYEGCYEVSDLGRVRSLDRLSVDSMGREFVRRGRVLKATINDGGYPSVHLSSNGVAKRIPSHVVMLRTFNGPAPAGYVGRHLDGQRLNCCLANLVWGTPAENGADTVKHGTGKHSEAHYRAKLTRAEVAEIGADRGRAYQYELGESYGVSASTVGRIQLRKTWNHV